MATTEETLARGSYLYGQALAALYSDVSLAAFKPEWGLALDAIGDLDIASHPDGGKPQEVCSPEELRGRVEAFGEAMENLRARMVADGAVLGSYEYPNGVKAAAEFQASVLRALAVAGA